jgi:hypothetical protein
MVVVIVIVGAVLPATLMGWSANLELPRAWLDQMAAHNAALIYTGGDGYEAVNTVYSFLHRALFVRWMDRPATWEVPLVLGLIAVWIGLFVLRNIRAGIKADQATTFEFLLLLALVPCITLTDTEHFILALPLVLYLMHQLLPQASPRWLAFAAIPLFLAYGGNWEDALGPLSGRLVHYGVLGIGTMALLVLVVMLFLRPTGSYPVSTGSANSSTSR